MSTAGRVEAPAVGWLRRLEHNARTTLAILMRPPRSAFGWWQPGPLAAATAVAIIVVVATMFALDAWAIAGARRLPAALLAAAREFTDLGKSGWFLWPLGVILLTLALIDAPQVARASRVVLAAFAVRVGFVFLAIALPGLFVTIVKRLIGRGRPFVGPDIWAYDPFAWQARYASFPSGHATTAFSVLVAFGAIFPQARALLWIYAVLIAISRVAVTAHHPSDVIAGAIVGAVGALMVRNWFAARRLGFAVRADGTVRPMPGPSIHRIIKAVARRGQAA